MCCLFGFVNYSGKKNADVNTLVNQLAQEATVRGVDSTGIAYNKDGKLTVYKKPLSAYEMQFKGVENSVCVTGHTRHATQGSHKKNYNNHPFFGTCNNVKFALSHNGVLWNDRYLQKQYNIPKNRIETDSYVAVQLLEHFGTLDPDNIKRMAEAVSGSFSFTILDNTDTLWIVKGDSPLTIVHFPEEKLFVYASTTEILFAALSHTDLVYSLASNDFELIDIKNGDIMEIDKRGKITIHRFHNSNKDSYKYSWQNYGGGWIDEYDSEEEYLTEEEEYIEDLKTIAKMSGIDEEEIDELITAGFTLEEIEDYIYYTGSYK